MLEDERAALVGVAAGALFLLEPAEQRPRRGSVWIMARRAFVNAFTEAMALVECQFRERPRVAVEADTRGSAELRDFRRRNRLAQQRRCRSTMLAMTVRAREARACMRAAVERRMRGTVAP